MNSKNKIRLLSTLIPPNYQTNNLISSYFNLIKLVDLLKPYNTELVQKINGKEWRNITKLLTAKTSYDISKKIIHFLYPKLDKKEVSRLSKTFNLIPIIKYKGNNFSNHFKYDKYQLFLQDKKIDLQKIFSMITPENPNTINTKIHLDTLDNDTTFFYLYHSVILTLEEMNSILTICKSCIITDNDKPLVKDKKLNTFKNKKMELLTHIIKFHSYLQYYFHLYQEWKEKDRQSSVDTLIKNYWELEITIQEIMKSEKMDDQQKEDSIETIKKQQREIEFFTERIGGPDSLKKLKQTLPVLFDESMTDNIKDTLQLVFWDNIKKEIIEENNYQKFKEVIQELKVLLMIINTKKEFGEEINSYLDEDFIINLITGKVYTLKECQKINTYFFELTKKYDAVVYDTPNEEHYVVITNQLTEIEEIFKKGEVDLSNNKDYINYIISMLSIIINHYYQVFKRIAQQKIDFLKTIADK